MTTRIPARRQGGPASGGPGPEKAPPPPPRAGAASRDGAVERPARHRENAEPLGGEAVVVGQDRPAPLLGERHDLPVPADGAAEGPRLPGRPLHVRHPPPPR